MQPGDLNEEIVIQSYTEAQGSTGEVTYSWTTFATVWANVLEQTGREYFTSDQHFPEAKSVFRIYYRNDLTRKMRVSYRDEYWGIESIREMKDPNKMHLTELQCKAFVE